MGATPVLLLPYPEPSDPADVPTDMNELATRIETVRGATNGLASLGADGKAPTAKLPAAVATPPGQELAYAQITTSKSITSGAEASADPVVAAPATTFTADPILIEFFAPSVIAPGVANGVLNFWLYQD